MRIFVSFLLVIFVPMASFAKGEDRWTAEFYPFETTPELGRTTAGSVIFLGGFSGLTFAGRDSQNNNPIFYTHTDRGPNAEEITLANGKKVRPFALPQFQPEIVQIELDVPFKMVHVLNRKKLFQKKWKKLSGLPPPVEQGSPGEFPVDLCRRMLPPDPNGVDLEAIVYLPDGTFWLADEYRPSLLHFDTKGHLIEWILPGKGMLPEILQERKLNRGFEALAYAEGKLFAVLQSPLQRKSVQKESRIVRIVEWDLQERKTTGQYLYAIQDANYKIGDAVALHAKKILILEQNGKTGPEKADQKIYAVDLAKATNISKLDESHFEKMFEAMSPKELRKNGIRMAKKKLYINLSKLGLHQFEKLEGMTLLDDGSLALVHDNDFTGKNYLIWIKLAHFFH